MDKLKISFEYGVSPIWLSIEDSFYENYAIDEPILGFSGEIIADLVRLNNLYQNTYNPDYPPDSKFTNKNEEKEFIELGLKVRDRIFSNYSGKFEINWID